MRERLEGRRRRGTGDKWFGMTRIGVNAVARMGFGVAVARIAGPEGFALFVGLVTVEVLATTVLSAGWITPFSSLAPGLPAARRDAFLWDGVRRTLGAIGGIVALLLVGAPLAVGSVGTPVGVYLAFCASTGAWLLSNAGATALAARFASARALTAQGIAQLAPATGLALAATVDGLDPLLAFFAGNAIGHGAAAMIALGGLPRAAADDRRANDAAMRSYGRVVLAGSIANSACTRIQPFVLAAVGGAPAIAAFGAASTLVGPARVFSGALGEVLRPRLALHQGPHGEAARAGRAVGLALASLAVLCVLLFVAFVVAGEWISGLVFGPGFEGLAAVLPWAAVFVLVAATANVLVVAMQTLSLAGTATATRARIVAAALSLLAVWPACAWDGARGAFAAMTVAEFVFLAAAVRFLAASRRARVADAARLEVA